MTNNLQAASSPQDAVRSADDKLFLEADRDEPNANTRYAENYRKPPKEFQYPKGKSGNPGGRPKGKRLAFDPGKILEAIDNEESIFIIDGKRTTQKNLEMHFRQLFSRSIDGEIAAARLIANMLPRFFGPEEKGPSDVKFVVKPDEFFDPKNRDNQNNEQSEIRPGNSKGRTENTSQPISPRSAFRRVALERVSHELDGERVKMEYLQLYVRQIYSMALNKTSAARILDQVRMQFPGDAPRGDTITFYITKEDANL